MLETAFVERRQVFIAGNGGSSATASHMSNDLMKGVAKESGSGFRAISLCDSIPLITAIANDESYDQVFSEQLSVLGQRGDILIVLSGSGNSPNIVRAVEVAQEMQIETIAFLAWGAAGW